MIRMLISVYYSLGIFLPPWRKIKGDLRIRKVIDFMADLSMTVNN